MASFVLDKWTIAAFIPLIFVLWLYTAQISRSFPTLAGQRILLLTAHPDDEAMFFAPTLQTLIRPELENQVKILCLSTGNADGLGTVRSKELVESAKILGMNPTNDVIILDKPDIFPDGPKPWAAKDISAALTPALAPSLAKTPKNKAVTTGVDVIITFDRHGVSSHPNHKSCYDGALAFIKDLTAGRPGWDCPVALYTLNSVNILRKYAFLFDAIPTIVSTMFTLARAGGGRVKSKVVEGRRGEEVVQPMPKMLLCVSGVMPWYRAQKAMVKGHWSQMVWFRWGWIGFGRYLLINDLHRIKL